MSARALEDPLRPKRAKSSLLSRVVRAATPRRLLLPLTLILALSCAASIV